MRRPTPEQKLPLEIVLERLKDPSYLPTRGEVVPVWCNEGTGAEWFRHMYKDDSPIFEVLTQEYLDALTDYLIERADHFRATNEKPLVILNAGAGKEGGRLAHFLVQKLAQRDAGKRFTIIPTDPREGEWGDTKLHFPVEKISLQNALEKYKPTVVLQSWMDADLDSSPEFRKIPSVDEYILIGEPFMCGDAYKTYGDTPALAFRPSEDGPGEIAPTDDDYEAYADSNAAYETNEPPPYEKDGFRKTELDNISKYQLCRTDVPKIDEATRPRSYLQHSRTISFRRTLH